MKARGWRFASPCADEAIIRVSATANTNSPGLVPPPPLVLPHPREDAPCVTFRLVVAPLRGPGRSPVLPFACCVGSLLSVGRCGRCSCWCRFRVCGAQRLVCWDCAECAPLSFPGGGVFPGVGQDKEGGGGVGQIHIQMTKVSVTTIETRFGTETALPARAQGKVSHEGSVLPFACLHHQSFFMR